MTDFVCIGRIKPENALEICSSKLGLGFEKLDRGLFVPEDLYDKVADLGVKWVRIQSGWQRTEKSPGVYDFVWLDEIVDNLVSRKLRPWITLCYGNSLYTPAAREVFGAVGCPPIGTQKERDAWRDYVKALVRHFTGRVEHYEVWNEPDGDWCWKHGHNGREYGEFAAATCRAILDASPVAKPIVGSMCTGSMNWLAEVAAAGGLDLAWGFTYHEYTQDETNNPEKVRLLRAFINRRYPEVRIIQGESGSQSRSDGSGALQGMAWTEEKQAKQLLRHTVSDLLCDVEFSSFFSCVDMAEALNGKIGNEDSYKDYGYFGLLSSTFDSNGVAHGPYAPKRSYFAMQNLCSIFKESPDVDNPSACCVSENSALMGWRAEVSFKDVTMGGFERSNGARAFTYWKKSDIITQEIFETASFEFTGYGTFARPVLADPMDGRVYAIPEKMIQDWSADCFIIRHLPLKDYPLFLFFGDFASINTEK